jgi:iron uptake system component EfeO
MPARSSLIFRVARLVAAAACLPAFAAGCGGDSSGPTDEAGVAKAMQASLTADLTELHKAAMDLQAAAPSGHAWSATGDAAAITAMKAAWVRARTAYEHVEGAIAPIFPELDAAVDERYDGFLADIGPTGDANLFDGTGVTGMHGIERVLYSESIPANVVAFEMSLPGYKAAAFPATAEEADAFKNGLAAQLVTDTQTLLDQWTQGAAPDVSGAFQGLIGLMNEQQEKVNNAATGEEESRYSQRTMADLRANLDGTSKIYGLFRGWLKTKPAAGAAPSGTAVDASITAGMNDLGTLYGMITGDAIPPPPATWSAENPSTEDLATPFGMLYQAVSDAADPADPDSVVGQMDQAAMLLGIPGFEQ